MAVTPRVLTSSAQIRSCCVPFSLNPSWCPLALLRAYSKAKLKSNGVKVSPCFKPFFAGERARQIHASPDSIQVSLKQNCEKRLLASSYLSVCQSVRLTQTEWIFMKFGIWRFFENLPRIFFLNLCMQVNWIYKRTLRKCNRHLLSTATMVTRTHINVPSISAEPVLLLTQLLSQGYQTQPEYCTRPPS